MICKLKVDYYIHRKQPHEMKTQSQPMSVRYYYWVTLIRNDMIGVFLIGHGETQTLFTLAPLVIGSNKHKQ